MSLKHYAMLAAISYNQQQQHYSSNNNNNNNNSNLTTNIATTIGSEALTKIINSNKSSLIQLKQQQQQLVAPTTAAATTITTTISSKSLSASVTPSVPIPAAVHPFHGDRTSTHVHHINSNGIGGIANVSGSSSSNSAYFDDDNDNVVSGEESSEILEPIDSGPDVPRTPPQPHQPNTYTSTTYYGSGFGVFHQQNIRTNGGGGIALITGSSGSTGLGGSSYSNGINNNVNLLLGGAMLTLISTILCVVCYCCHRNIKKRTEAAYRQQRQWLENDPNMEIYSVEQCYETSGLFVGDSMDGLATIPALHHEPPPSYDAVVAMQEQQQLLMQQQQLLMQQQLLQQQAIPSNNSPPPGYRSSLDVSSIMPQQQRSAAGLGSVLGMGGSIVSGMDVNSLASSTVNIGTANSHSPVDPLMNYNDVNGNVDTSNVALTVAVTPTNNNKTINFLRNKQHQQQRNLPQTQLTQLNMKKVLQAQSCCSLQRAEVENMWNAAAAALAARSSHIPNTNDTRSVAAAAVATASTSSPMLAMNVRKLSQGYANSSKSNTPETFGSRYLKQNYYRSGCPLCGKFRYDNDSQLSISMESNLDTLQGALNETPNSTNDLDRGQQQTEQNDLNGNENIQKSTTNSSINDGNENNNVENDGQEVECLNRDEADSERDDYELNNEADDDDDDDDDDDNECTTVEEHCSCTNSRRKLNKIKYENRTRYQKVNLLKDNNDLDEQDSNSLHQNEQYNQTIMDAAAADANANANAERQSTTTTTHQASNNNSNDNPMDMPSTSTAATSIPRTTATSGSLSSSSATSIPSVTINLDCINENGIISLDMSKIIDKTGLPTYDAALKLESSGYV